MLLKIPASSILKTYYDSHFVDSYYTVFLRVCKTHSKYHLQLTGGSNKLTESVFKLNISEVPQKDSEHPSPCINSCCSFQLAKIPKSICLLPTLSAELLLLLNPMSNALCIKRQKIARALQANIQVFNVVATKTKFKPKQLLSSSQRFVTQRLLQMQKLSLIFH